jgi:hypothetical protein
MIEVSDHGIGDGEIAARNVGAQSDGGAAAGAQRGLKAVTTLAKKTPPEASGACRLVPAISKRFVVGIDECSSRTPDALVWVLNGALKLMPPAKAGSDKVRLRTRA